MRNLRNPRLERGEVRIEDIELDFKSRDDIPVILIGLQYLYSQKAVRDRIFALPGVNEIPMAMWTSCIGCGQARLCDFDRLHELANQHMAIRLPLSADRQCEP